MITKYGNYSQENLSSYKQILHSKIHWMLLYKDPKIQEKYNYVDVNKYIQSVQIELNGLNEILLNQPQLISLMSKIESARLELNNKNFNYKIYRKILLDAHSLVDKLPETEGECDG